MPSFCIHLAIGNLYATKNKINDKSAFDSGIIAPDFQKDKEKSHYSAPKMPTDTLLDIFNKKVQLAEFLKVNSIDDDYNKGVFLHLITDYIYFTKFFSKDLIIELGEDFLPSMYYSYDLVKDHVENKYDVKYPGEISGIIENINNKRKILGFDKGITKPNIIPMEKLDKFIDFCANINLENFAKKIRSTQTNISLDEIEFC